MMQKHPPGGYECTPDLIWRIQYHLDMSNRTWKDLVSAHAISIRTWRSWTSPAGRAALITKQRQGKPSLVRPSNFRAIAGALGISVDALLTSPALHFSSLCDAARKIDASVLTLTRALSEDLPLQDVLTAYRDHLDNRLREYDMTLPALLGLLNDASCRASIARTLPDTGLTIDVDPTLARISYSTRAAQCLSVDHPRLMWDCSCTNLKSRRKHCAIHKQSLSAPIEKAFNECDVEIKWGRLRFMWKNAFPVWPPSIDSFTMIHDLARTRSKVPLPNAVIDIGTGTGFLGIAYAAENVGVRRALLSDWLVTPLLYAAVNWECNLQHLANAKPTFKLGLFASWDNDDRRPLNATVLCNPPYLPLLGAHRPLGMKAFVAGTDLLTFVIENGMSIGRQVFLQFSQLANPEAAFSARRAGRQLHRVTRRARTVPFRVRQVLNDATYMRALVEQRKLIVKRGADHKYWHRIATWELR